MAVTLHTIAKKAGVSAPVVSAVVNNNYKNCRVSPEKRKRIEQLIEELNYLPNATARNLVKKETRTVNIIIPSVNFFASTNNNRFMMGVQDALEGQGYRITFTSLQRGYRDYRGVSDVSADALLVFMWGERQEYVVRKLLKFNKPLMVAFAKYDLEGVHNIYYDNMTPMYDLTRTLIARGHTAIMYAEVFGGDYFHEQARMGIEKAVGEAENITYRKVRFPTEDFDYYKADQFIFDMGRSAAETCMNEMPGATALMCSHDIMAFGAIRRLEELGHSVPGDISVTGGEDHPLAGSFSPPLTTVATQAVQAGRLAGNRLVDIMAGVTTERVVEKVVNEIVIRESVKNLNKK